MGDFNYLSNVTSLSWDACVFLYKDLFFFANHVHKDYFIPPMIFIYFYSRL